MKSNKFIVISLLLVGFIAICVVAVLSKIYTIDTFPLGFMGALLGAIIAAILTGLFISGQADADEINERYVKVFEKKSEIFQNYINIVWEVWDARTVSDKEYLKLTESYYKTLMLYLKKESLETIGENLSNIGDLIQDDGQSHNIDALQNYLIAIINVLSDEISLGGHIDFNQIQNLKKLAAKREVVVARTKSKRTTFQMLKVKIGTELVFIKDTTVKCITIDEKNQVEYKGKQYAISTLATELNKGIVINGFDYFKIEGKAKTLGEMRIELEKQ